MEEFKKALADNLYYSRGQAAYTASEQDAYMALSYTVRDHLIDRWRRTVDAYFKNNPKFIFYLSAEFLMGRQLPQNLLYTDTTELAQQALVEFRHNLDELIELDQEPGLGNGGLGRLAACFLDSLATMDIPCIGYGIRYEFGIFKQSFKNGWQVESPDEWLYIDNPWEFPQPDDMVEIKFGGRTEPYVDENGNYRVRWVPAETILAEPYHTLVPGYNTGTVNLLRLWRARASKEFDFQLFDHGDYARAVEQKVLSENISKVLYPNDNNPQGKELRLRQQYFFTAASLQDIIRRYLAFNKDLRNLPDKTVIQLNDTHPVIGIPELMRILIDDYQLTWEEAWDITTRTFTYTCHTLLPEALEKWPVGLFEHLLPRHLEIIYEINSRFLTEVRAKFPGEELRTISMSIIEEGFEREVRMAHLACVGSFSVNGVAELHSKLLREQTLREFAKMWPEKFSNKTNGVTPRRFMKIANPRLADLITKNIGDGWLNDLEQLQQLEPLADRVALRSQWRQVKQENKKELAQIIQAKLGITVDPDSMFDVMVKRLHEYKRQHLKALHIITLYNRIKAKPNIDIMPRTFIFGAKAAPGYQMAKLIIKLINNIADVVNNDPDVRDRLKVVYLPNFNVTLGQKIYPAADLSEQISLAGKEASGTGNMKFALNGALTVGTLDGANIEIRERVGEEHFFLFGLTADEVFAHKAKGHRPLLYYRNTPELKAAIDAIASGRFSNGDTSLFQPIVNSLLQDDPFLLLVDYESYIEIQDEIDRRFRLPESWTRSSILNTARCGFFSSDRSMQQYCDEIWKVKPVKVEME